MNCRIVIVDDEPRIVEGIKYLLQKDIPEVNISGDASDGIQGYELIVKEKPDIALVDIRMPNRDGLSMIESLMQSGSRTKFVILTSYSEFEYAQRAIKLGVKAYITKPVDREELFSTIHKLCIEIEKENVEKQQFQSINNIMENYGSDLMEYTLRQYLELPESEISRTKFLLQELGQELQAAKYVCVLFEFVLEEKKYDVEELCCKVKKRVENYFFEQNEKIYLRYSGNQILLILGMKQMQKEEETKDLIKKVHAELSLELDIQVDVGIGNSHPKKEIRLSLKEAKVALKYKVIRGGNTVIGYKDIAVIHEEVNLVQQEDIRELENYIENMDMENCSRLIEDIFARLNQGPEISMEALQDISLNLILLSIRKMPYIQFNISEYLGRDILSLENISRFKTIEQLKNWIVNTLKGMNDLMIQESVSGKGDVIEEAKRYIAKNYYKNISLNEISEHFYINPYYFSQLFKKKTGINYQAYLTELRVNRAKKLLEETNLKVYEICDMVGYANINHFNKVFERSTGMKPREYKDTWNEKIGEK